jgi:cold shock CspA family protein
MTTDTRIESGTVERLFFTKGFGFIRDEQDNLRYFHALWLVEGTIFEGLTIGQRVEFRPVNLPAPEQGTPKNNGRRAHDVRISKSS